MPASTRAGKDMPEQQRIFTISGNNKCLLCPFISNLCNEGYCEGCQIYLDWQKKGEFIVICAWCGDFMGTKPDLGNKGVSHGICSECKAKYFPRVKGGGRNRE